MSNRDVEQNALQVLLERLESIDENPNTRAGFCADNILSTMNQLDKPMFEHEINLIRATLNLPAVVKQEETPKAAYVSLAPRELQLDEL